MYSLRAKIKKGALVPLLLVFPLYMGICGGHILPKNAPPTCPLRAPLFPPNDPNRLVNRG